MQGIWETQVQALGWEDALEEGMATLSSILAWRIPWTGQSIGHTESDMAEAASHSTHEQLYANKMDNVEEMDKFLEKVHSPVTESGRKR